MINKLPLSWDDKVNSPELEAYFKQLGKQYYFSAEEINELRDAMNEMYGEFLANTDFIDSIDLTSPAPVLPGIYIPTVAGTYANYGGLVVDLTNKISRIIWNGTTFRQQIVAVEMSNYLKKSELNYELADFKIVSNNLFNKETIISGKYVNYATGQLSDNASYSASDYIKISPSTGYKRVSDKQIAFYTKNKVYISGIATTTGGSFTSPSEAYYVRLSILNSQINTEQLNLGTTLLPYDSFLYKNNELSINAEKVIGLPKIETLVREDNFDDFSKIKIVSNNLFNKDTVTSGKYVNYATGLLSDNAPYSASDYIKISPSTAYKKLSTQQIAYYDINKNYISGVATTTGGNFTTPSGAYYVRLTILNSQLNNEQLNLGNTLLTYDKYAVTREDLYIYNKNIIENQENTIKILIPSEIYLLKNQKFSIYFRNILKNYNSFKNKGYSIKVQAKSGSNYTAVGTGYAYKVDLYPSSTTSYDIEIRVLDDTNDSIITSKIVTVNTIDPNLITGKNINIITIGDSYTDLYGVSEALGLFANTYSSGVVANMLGVNKSTNPVYNHDAWNGMGHEFYYNSPTGFLRSDRELSDAIWNPGYGENEINGWTTGQTYEDLNGIQKQNGYTKNQFYNPSTSKFDFSYYITNRYPSIVPKASGPNNINAFISYLGINDFWFQKTSDLKAKIGINGTFRTILPYIYDSVLAFDPAIKIFIATIAPQPEDSKFMSNYGGNYITAKRVKYHQELWNEFILELFDNTTWKNKGVYVLPSAAHLDTRTSFISSDFYPCKFDLTYKERLDSDIHPLASVGSKYLADTGIMAIFNKAL